jgi:hypothetical protein
MSEISETIVSSANQAIEDPAPRMNTAPPTSVKLMRGVYHDGEWLQNAIIRELNGEDEEAIVSLTTKSDLVYSDYMSALLKRAVVSIDDISIAQNPTLIDTLIIGDRDLLFIGAMRATYGRFREMEVTCGNCASTNFVTLNLDEDFSFDFPKHDCTQPIEVELRDGSVIKMHYPTGGDSSYVAKKAKTTAEQNTIMLARCTEWGDDQPSNLEQWAKHLGVSDRSKLVRALTNTPPGPKMEEVKTQCAKCDEELLIIMDWVSLLFS